MSEFNLLDEKWISVLGVNGVTREVSLKEVFTDADEIISLANELPTLDIAIMRLLLAIMHSAAAHDAKDYTSAMELWRSLWVNGLPAERITAYLEQWRERFWLFDDKRPFGQVAEMKTGTEYKAGKLLGTMSESNNKPRLFPTRTGEEKTAVSYSEAARWLLYVNAYDDNSGKPSTRGAGLPSIGAGWLGQLGLVYAVGANLRETLLLNFFLLDREGNPWERGTPFWEAEIQRTGERTGINPPRSQAELLTLQSRRLSLKRENGEVTGYRLLGGDFFPKENAWVEQMTFWRKSSDKVNYVPKRHDPAKQLWRDFTSLTSTDNENERPGVVSWLAKIEYELELNLQFSYATASVVYGDKDFMVVGLAADSLSFNYALITNIGEEFLSVIGELLSKTDAAVKEVGKFELDLAEASGDRRDNKGYSSSSMKGKENAAKQEAYFRLDIPFREWLADTDPVSDDITEITDAWLGTAKDILLKLGDELVTRAGSTAFIGNGTKNSPNSHNFFVSKIRKILKEEANL